MGFSWPDQTTTANICRKRAIRDVLARGRDFANQLRATINGNPSASAEDLVNKILGSFGDGLSLLGVSDYDYEVSQAPAPALSSPASCWDSGSTPGAGQRSEDSSGTSCKTSAVLKDRRGCYKRRRTSETRIQETSAVIDDGHAWRKYGQKTILNAKYPRNYYRCTHKFDQLCQATKQVQQIEDDPCRMFRITYLGSHTCKDLFKSSQLILDPAASSPPPLDSSNSFLLSFDKGFAQPPAFSPIKRENHKLEAVGEDLFRNQFSRSASSHDYHFLAEVSSAHDDMAAAFSSAASEQDVISEVYSCGESTHSLENLGGILGGSHDDFGDFPDLDHF